MSYNLKTYFRLRSMLDAFETMALAHCLTAESDAEANERIDFISKSLSLESLQNSMAMNPRKVSGSPKCPPETPYYCNGACLPYPCPAKSDPTES